ncbi:MAG: hypothetical protein ACRDOY_13535 [Nocardioidaceae bacterium]
MAYLMLYGTGGWTQRWQIADGSEEAIRSEISHLGTEGTGDLPVVDSQADASATLVVAWAAVAAAIVVDSTTSSQSSATGPYA